MYFHIITIICTSDLGVLKKSSGRMMEESHPPTWYIPKEDIKMDFLKPSQALKTTCEFKGQAVYYDVKVKNKLAKMVAWTYPKPEDDQSVASLRYVF
mmetsp:Transcript_39843/g.66748  ORF Transcript_39843/g.66748 Transcript_39843/m.66748 type:complete len:97 (-) Transcript_39843:15-305(-)